MATCASHFEIVLEHPGAWAVGTFSVEVEADGAVGSCDVTFGADGSAEWPACTGTRGWELSLVGDTGTAAERPLSVLFAGYGVVMPDSIAVRVRSGGVEIGAQTYTPTYERHRPNGPGCDPVCETANPVTLTVQ
ncbi:MAG TPA: hypothetical protein PK668_11190 [Myxococcota bacterium]|nr:hypothetical protein [Myxococcota bacterium]HRY93270.1 hypothetical protein [Myxococcota bacterium]HSA19947.1 hypothetical protein [Myxococcota bacterium]